MSAATSVGRWGRRAAPALLVFGLMGLLGCGGGGSSGPTTFPGITLGSVDVACDPVEVTNSVAFSDELFNPTDCAVIEGAVGSGLRRLLRFDMVIVNYGELDLVLGDPASPVPPLTAADFSFASCHQHYHFNGWADYRLMDLTLTTVAAQGHKQAFCLLDSIPYSNFPAQGFNCQFQGLSSGWADLYDHTLDGQWVDVTGVPEGDYMLQIQVNAIGKVVELVDAHPDTIAVPVHIPNPLLPPP